MRSKRAHSIILSIKPKTNIVFRPISKPKRFLLLFSKGKCLNHQFIKRMIIEDEDMAKHIQRKFKKYSIQYEYRYACWAFDRRVNKDKNKIVIVEMPYIVCKMIHDLGKPIYEPVGKTIFVKTNGKEGRECRYSVSALRSVLSAKMQKKIWQRKDYDDMDLDFIYKPWDLAKIEETITHKYPDDKTE